MDWTPNELVYYFNDRIMFKHNLNHKLHSYYGNKWTTPFDQYFYIILNTAVGGDFLSGPSDSDKWTYPEAEFKIKSVKITPLKDIIDSR